MTAGHGYCTHPKYLISTPNVLDPISKQISSFETKSETYGVIYFYFSGVTETKTRNSSCNAKLYATCFVCGKQLSNQYNLRVHMETHQNAHYACSACNHVSRSRDALRKHVSYRHPQTPSAVLPAPAPRNP